MKHFLLFYEAAPDYLDRRASYRGAHLAYTKAAVERGELVLGGALTYPADRAMLMFKGESDTAAKAFAENDPYVHNRLVTSWKVREWITVVGADASVVIGLITGLRDIRSGAAHG